MYDARAEGPAVRPYLFAPLGVDREAKRERGGGSGTAENVERLRREAHTAGFLEGQKVGHEQGMARAAEVAERLESLIRSLAGSKEQACKRCHREMLALAVRIAEKILHRELRDYPAERLNVVAEGLKKVRESERIVIRVSPEDHEILEEALPALCERNGVNGTVVLRKDPAIAAGGCLLEGDHCQVDARVEQMLRTVEEALVPS